ncbi:MAG: acetate/propionate family kinase [Polyangiaceae bacterium]|nr:acetate/propionate family kinase [Polyangiaceae bacterium]
MAGLLTRSDGLATAPRHVLVFNCGSSSLKYSLLEMPSEREITRGEAQRVGPVTAEPARILHRRDGVLETVFREMPSHVAAYDAVRELFARDGLPRPDAIGHRLVHGGREFSGAASRLTPEADRALDAVAELAPIHNPPAIQLVRGCRDRAPDLPQVLVFDTSFHSTIGDAARTYALPQAIREGLGIRKYGFHGISHQYVVSEAARLLGVPLTELNAVSCHLGSGGASLCAVVKGKSADNTMGYSPLQGLIMSTRCGDLDPALTLQLLARAGGDARAVEQLLNHKSGVLGLSDRTADIRDVLAGYGAGGTLDEVGQTYLWRQRKYVGAYLALAAPARAIVFTDTIGETVPAVRAALCAGLEAFGVELDDAANRSVQELPVDVARRESRVRLLVIATNEELAIARITHAVLNGESATDERPAIARTTRAVSDGDLATEGA